MSDLRTFRLTVAYDGTAFHGWQKQPGPRTVQGELEAALTRVLGGEAVTTAGAGRTDAGVHARGQVATFSSATALPARAFPPLLHRELPDDVRVWEAAEAPAGFHARHSARARRYEYRLLEQADLLRERHAWAPGALPEIAALEAASAPIAGTHDFTAFQTASQDPGDPLCHVSVSRWRACEGGVAFDVTADHFLYRMVRNLVGTMLEVALGPDPARRMGELLAGRDRSRRGRPAPAHGLSLERVYFEGEEMP